TDILNLIDAGQLTAANAELAIRDIIEKTRDGFQITRVKIENIEALGLLKIKEDDVVMEAVKEAIAENPKAVEDYKGGKAEALNFIIGQVMRKTKGGASPDTVRQMLTKELE
ncbi:MAG: Asp-tRNA(Asn)/Glu-tRNA(Gln) amidotransferase GatCAB subunit B, partial [Candidatus Hydrothermarchaeota archaeon]|nr:Asp-tRNA(Asn)/Glu-tRNA(Gln) amidotransferase GatCAB subunit B [Candidatus Hydrothermarchaeota archaeon]